MARRSWNVPGWRFDVALLLWGRDLECLYSVFKRRGTIECLGNSRDVDEDARCGLERGEFAHAALMVRPTQERQQCAEAIIVELGQLRKVEEQFFVVANEIVEMESQFFGAGGEQLPLQSNDQDFPNGFVMDFEIHDAMGERCKIS